MAPKAQSSYPTLTKAPIILAILQLKFDLKENIEKAFFTKILDRVKEKYPKFEQTKSAQVQINPKDQKTPISLRLLSGDGYNFISTEGKDRFTISSNTFTFQLGSPYSTWETFFSEAWWAWKQCELEEKTNSIFWLSIRYINSFEIEGNDKKIMEPSDYFKSYPQMASKDQDYTRFLIQYTLPIEPPNIHVNVGIESRETVNNIFPLMFDLDAICLTKIGYNEVQVKEIFSKLRDYKNTVFFNNLTEKTLQLFK